MTGTVRIDAARGLAEEAGVFARLLGESMGGLERVWGRRGPVLAERLFRSPGSRQSWTCTSFAAVDGTVVGMAIAFPSEEYGARSAEAQRLENAVLPAPDRWRRGLVRVARRLRRTQLGPLREDSVYLEALAVLPAFRRRGIAEALYRHVCGGARGRAVLECDVASVNGGALRFYAAQGCRVALRRGGLSKLTCDLAHGGGADLVRPSSLSSPIP